MKVDRSVRQCIGICALVVRSVGRDVDAGTWVEFVVNGGLEEQWWCNVWVCRDGGLCARGRWSHLVHVVESPWSVVLWGPVFVCSTYAAVGELCMRGCGEYGP